MKLSVKALAITSGVVWSGGILTCGLINLAVPSYGRQFLKVMSSVYPGFRNVRTVPDVLVGAGYGFVDGAIGGALIAALYNGFADGTAGFGAETRSLAVEAPKRAGMPT
jgi:hypothetical protein